MSALFYSLLVEDMPAWAVVILPPALVAGAAFFLASVHWSAALAFVVLVEATLRFFDPSIKTEPKS